MAQGKTVILFRLLCDGREVGRVEVNEAQGRFRAVWPDEMPDVFREQYERGEGPFWGPSSTSHTGWAEYWHYALTVGAGPWWDRVETDYRPPEYPTRGPDGGLIVY